MTLASRLLPLLLCLATGWVLITVSSADESTRLDVSIVVFRSESHQPTAYDPSDLNRIRGAETGYMPYVLRHHLEQSDVWGAIRVIPEHDESAELLLAATIVEASGLSLVLDVKATDATGKRWIDQRYTSTTTDDAYRLAAKGSLLFGDLYTAIGTDLAAILATTSTRDRDRIRDTSWLRYAGALIPDAFASHLSRTADGQYQLLRLPALDDPMVARINRVRAYEYLFIDTVDEQYANLYGEMTPAYNSWRKYDREQKLYLDNYRERIEQREKPKRGTFQALQATYNNYKWSKVQEQEAAMMANTLASELEPTVLDVEGSIVELSGSLDQRYAQWREILRELHLLESG